MNFALIDSFGFKYAFSVNLKEVIKALNETEFQSLIEFVTGSKCYTDNIIFQKVKTNILHGHTCSNTLDIPEIYEELGYDDLLTEFKKF